MNNACDLVLQKSLLEFHHSYPDVDQVFLLKEIINLNGQDHEFGGSFKLFYHGVNKRRNMVGIILKEEHINRLS